MAEFLKVLVISIALAMDALSVSIVSGIKARQIKVRDAIKVATCFGLFQAGMPIIGWVVGEAIRSTVDSYSGVIAFSLLVVIGIKMIYDSIKGSEEAVSSMSWKMLIGMGIATSIDALIVGTTLSLISVPLLLSVIIIGVTTFIISTTGYMFGIKIGAVFGERLEILGGVVLILLGITFLF